MSEEVCCPACGAPPEAEEKIAQFREVIRIQSEQLDAANQRVRDLEELLRFGGFPRPGTPPPTAPPAVPPGFPRTPFQGKAGGF